ncbi:MAG: pyridoxamine 5'-phosphate oxidase family protein [Clostridia bacterium]|nr:pyridoxamine 5'-phosphate oxidase family protein [Clostridia bacterium]
MRRADRERDFDFAAQVVKESDYATVSFTGDAYAVPFTPLWHDGAIYMHCANEGEKLERIKANPRVCISAVSQAVAKPGKFGLDYKSAIFFADAKIVTDPDEKMKVLVAIAARHAPTLPDRMEKYARGLFDRATLVRFEIVSGTGKQCVIK